jgi:hypothetical protein
VEDIMGSECNTMREPLTEKSQEEIRDKSIWTGKTYDADTNQRQLSSISR